MGAAAALLDVLPGGAAMNGLAWFVRSVRSGDTHLASTRWNGSAHVRPVCAPEIEFRAMNRRPLAVCFYDEQRCPLCLSHAPGSATAPPRAQAVMR